MATIDDSANDTSTTATSPERQLLFVASEANERLLSAGDLAALPEALPSGPVRYELHVGKLAIMTPPGHEHGEAQICIGAHFMVQGVWKKLGRGFTETSILIRRDPDTVLVPDVCFIGNDRLPFRATSQGYLETIPHLIVEIRSKNNTLAELNSKAQAYLNVGAETVWLIDELSRSLIVVTKDAAAQTYTEDQTVPPPAVLPDLKLTVRELLAPMP